jgi:hypothetical protein
VNLARRAFIAQTETRHKPQTIPITALLATAETASANNGSLHAPTARDLSYKGAGHAQSSLQAGLNAFFLSLTGRIFFKHSR